MRSLRRPPSRLARLVDAAALQRRTASRDSSSGCRSRRPCRNRARCRGARSAASAGPARPLPSRNRIRSSPRIRTFCGRVVDVGRQRDRMPVAAHELAARRAGRDLGVRSASWLCLGRPADRQPSGFPFAAHRFELIDRSVPARSAARTCRHALVAAARAARRPVRRDSLLSYRTSTRAKCCISSRSPCTPRSPRRHRESGSSPQPRPRIRRRSTSPGHLRHSIN